MRIVRRSSFAAARWKNGGGITHEAIRVPAHGNPHRWRLSVAEIASSGPFSDFSGYRRCMVLLAGAGLRLTFANDGETLLRRAGDLVEFDGGVATGCELLAGPCTDLNLMTAESIGDVEARVARLGAPLELSRRAGETLVVFCVTGAAVVEDGTDGPASVVAHDLGQWDLAVRDGAAGSCIVRSSGDGREEGSVFTAKFTDI